MQYKNPICLNVAWRPLDYNLSGNFYEPLKGLFMGQIYVIYIALKSAEWPMVGADIRPSLSCQIL
jgi:hypothetical protein